MRVLFVEDNAINRQVVRQMLTLAGLEMDEAEGGEPGLALIEARDYDLVLMDLRMPGMDGLSAIRQLRARPDCKAALPVIVVTADGAADIKAQCLAAGADDLVLKPIVMEALFDAIAGVMARLEGGEALIA